MTQKQNLRHVVAAGAIGNLIEFYDFAVYGFLAATLGTLFFPSSDPNASLVASFGAFAAGFVARPLGGAIFGHIGDRIGRRPVLIVSVALMGVATVAIACLPVHEDIGWLAGALLITLRVVQGLSLGGEYSGSLTFLAEHAPPEKRGLLCSFVIVGNALGFLLGAAVPTVVESLLSSEAFLEWGWRVPFVIGGLLALLGLFLRHGVVEPPRPSGEPVRLPLVWMFRHHGRTILHVLGLYLGVNAGFYIVFVYFMNAGVNAHGPRHAYLQILTIICLFILTILPPVVAYASDKVGRRPFLLVGYSILLLATVPLYFIMEGGDGSGLAGLIVGQVGFALVFGLIIGVNPVTQVEVTPAKVRVSLLSVSTNGCMAIFGGTTPLVAAFLTETPLGSLAPAVYLTVLGLLSLIVVILTKETFRNDVLAE